MAGKAVESRWTLKDLFTPRVKEATSAVETFQGELRKTKVAGETFARSESRNAAVLLKRKAAFKENQRAMQDLTGVTQMALPFLGAGIGAAFGSAIRSASQFQDSLATVGTLLSGTTQQVKSQLNSYTPELESLARSSGKSLTDLAGGLYQTISAGVDAKDAMTVLTASAKAAVAGLTDTNTSVDVVTSSLNAYHMKATDASKVTDTLLKTVQLGKTTFPELAQSMGLVLPSASSLHISFSDLNSSIAALTLVGLKTPEAISGLNEAFMNILKPSSQAQAEAKKLGIQFNAQALQAKGLIPFLQEIKSKTHGNTQAMSDFFGSIQGLNAMLALTSNNGMAKLISSQKQMQNASGTTQQQFKIMTNTLSAQWKKTSQDVITSVVNMVMKFHVLDGLSKLLKMFESHFNVLVPILGGVAIALGVYATYTTIAKVATIAFSGALKLTPLGVISMALGVLAMAAIWVGNNMQTAKLLWMNAWNDILKGTQWGVNKGIDLVNVYLESYKFAFDAIEYAGISIWDAILKASQKGINHLLQLIAPLSGLLKHVGINIPKSVDFSGLSVKATPPKFDTSFGLHHVNLTGAGYTPSEIHAQAIKAKAERDNLTKQHIQALNANTKALSQNSQSTDNNTAASSANTKALGKGSGQDMSAEQIADKLMPRLQRHLYGTMG